MSISIPDDLAELDRWACWRLEEGRKVPYRTDGRRAASTSAEDWGPLDQAQKALATGRFTGLGFAFFAEDGLVGVDLDDALIDGEPKPVVQPILERFADTYSEVSPSRTGLKLWCRGTLSRSIKTMLAEGVGLELYSTGRYFTFTGERFRGSPLEVADHTADIAALLSRNGSNNGTTNGTGPKDIPSKIREGARHMTLLTIAGKLRRAGLVAEEIDGALQVINARRCEPPRTAEHVRKLAESMTPYEPAEDLCANPNVKPPTTPASDLYEGNVKEMSALFEGLLWDGLSLLVAKPKAGKSWLTLQLAIAVAGGRAVEGITPKENGPVLYLALEEPKSRTMARLRKLAPQGDWATRLHFAYELLPLTGGGIEQLRELIDSIQPRFIVIDTLTAAIKGGRGGKRDNDVFGSQYAELASLLPLIHDKKIAMVVVHHSRKGGGEDAIDATAGTGGVTAAVDCVWWLRRKPESEATLEVVGREIEESVLALRFDKNVAGVTFGWAVLGYDPGEQLSAERREIWKLLCEGALTPAQIAAELEKESARSPHVIDANAGCGAGTKKQRDREI